MGGHIFDNRPKCAPNVENLIESLESQQKSVLALISSKTTDEATEEREAVLISLKRFYNDQFADAKFDQIGNLLTPGRPGEEKKTDMNLEQFPSIACPYGYGRKYNSIDGRFDTVGVQVQSYN